MTRSMGMIDSPVSAPAWIMTSDFGIYRIASVLIREYGEDAAVEAAERADAMLKSGHPDAAAVWKRVTLAVEDIRRTELGPGETHH